MSQNFLQSNSNIHRVVWNLFYSNSTSPNYEKSYTKFTKLICFSKNQTTELISNALIFRRLWWWNRKIMQIYKTITNIPWITKNIYFAKKFTTNNFYKFQYQGCSIHKFQEISFLSLNHHACKINTLIIKFF